MSRPASCAIEPAASGDGAAGPQTIRPRSHPRSIPASAPDPNRAADSDARDKPTCTAGAIHPAANSLSLMRASRSRSSLTSISGSRIGRLRCTGPAGISVAVANARRSDRAVIAVEVEARGGGGEIDAPSRVTTEHPDLVDGLCGAAIARLGRTVGGDDDQRNLGQGSSRRPRAGSWRRRCPKCIRG